MRYGIRRHWSITQIGVTLSFLVVSVTGAASAASNTVPASNAGQGVSVVAGFSVTNAKAFTAGSVVDEVTFTIARLGTNAAVTVNTGGVNPDANVFVQLRGTGTPSQWVACSVTGGAATCDTTAQAVAQGTVNAISVVAYDA